MPHSKSPGYQGGNHWVECQVCGFDYRHDVMKLRWDNLIVCPKDYETRQPQDFVRAREDKITPDGLINPPAEIVQQETGDPTTVSIVPDATSCFGLLTDTFYIEDENNYWPKDYHTEGCE